MNIWEQQGFLTYGIELTDLQKGTAYGWTPSAWLAASSEERENATNTPGITGNITGYAYLGNNITLKTTDTSSIRYKIIFGETNDKIYWLASRGFITNSVDTVFSPGFIAGGITGSCNDDLFHSFGVEDGNTLGIRPVVYLKLNIKLTEASTTEEGVTTWNIDV